MAGTVVRREAAAEQNPAYRGTVFVFFLFPMYWGNSCQPIRHIMNKRIARIVDFIKVGIWHVKRKDVPAWKYFVYSAAKKLLLAVERATTKRMMNAASALTYSQWPTM